MLIYLSTDCPVSNFYCPEYSRLAKQLGPKGVVFYGVHADPDVAAKEGASHAQEYGLTFPVLFDPTHAVARLAGVKVVPEAVVVSPQGRVLYRGRIDDRYNAAGVRRENPTSRDLEEVLAAVLAGRQPRVMQTTAFGCPLPEPRKSK